MRRPLGTSPRAFAKESSYGKPLQFVRLLRELALVEIVLLDLVDETRAADAELLREPGLVPPGALEAFADHLALELFESITQLALNADTLHFAPLAVLPDASGEHVDRDLRLTAGQH